LWYNKIVAGFAAIYESKKKGDDNWWILTRIRGRAWNISKRKSSYWPRPILHVISLWKS